MKMWKQDKKDPTHMRYSWVDIPKAYEADAAKGREAAARCRVARPDELLTAILEGKPVSEEMIRHALRIGTLSGKLTPVHCGSSKEYYGVRLLLDAVCDYLPSPADRPPVEGTNPKTKEKIVRKPER